MSELDIAYSNTPVLTSCH